MYGCVIVKDVLFISDLISLNIMGVAHPKHLYSSTLVSPNARFPDSGIDTEDNSTSYSGTRPRESMRE